MSTKFFVDNALHPNHVLSQHPIVAKPEIQYGKGPIRWLLNKLSGKHVYIGGEPYLTRYYLIGDGKGARLELYLHILHHVDTERWCHNHPWKWFVSVILLHGYVQRVVDAKSGSSKLQRIRRISWFHGLRRYHSICDLPKGPAWTLVLASAKMGHRWGYWDEERKLHIPDDRVESTQSKTVRFGRKHTVN